ncbi:MAG: protein TolQ [Deltaproteobacteria bacterium]|nr:protein TolQ [Deltaproteobacteria bacterium]
MHSIFAFPVAAQQKASATDISLWDTVTHSGPVVFSILVLLLVFSVVSWGIIAHKAAALRRATRQSASFLDAFWQSGRMDAIYGRVEEFDASPVAAVFKAGFRELQRVMPKAGENREAKADDMLGGVENVERAMRRAAGAQLTGLESLIPFLATTGSTAPFIGLLGTVLGIMKSFQQIGTVGVASLATVAPGISEALIATAVGLFAAIPAVIAFNFFNARIRVLSAEMEQFAADFMNIVRRHFMGSGAGPGAPGGA